MPERNQELPHNILVIQEGRKVGASFLTKAPKPFESFTVDTSGESGRLVEKKTTKFFVKILDFVGYDKHARESLARTESYTLKTPTTETDNRITTLVVIDHTLASVLERRNQLNDIEVVFAHYLSPHVVKRLRDYIRK